MTDRAIDAGWQSAAAELAAMLHWQIMNIQAGDPGLEDRPDVAYQLGHRDARHAAADVVMAQIDPRVLNDLDRRTACFDELVAALEALAFAFEVSIRDYEDSGAWQAASAALAAAKGVQS